MSPITLNGETHISIVSQKAFFSVQERYISAKHQTPYIFVSTTYFLDSEAFVRILAKDPFRQLL